MQSNITFATKLSPPCAGTALQTGSKEAQGLACLADIAVMRKWSDEASEHGPAFEDLLARFNVQHQRQALLTGVGTQSWPNWSPRGPKGPVSLRTIKLAVARERVREREGCCDKERAEEHEKQFPVFLQTSFCTVFCLFTMAEPGEEEPTAAPPATKQHANHKLRGNYELVIWPAIPFRSFKGSANKSIS